MPIVVLNGQNADPEIEERLHSDDRIRLVRLERADLPASLKAGREVVETPWFAELDDDDILLPGALACRVQALQEAEDFDAVVTNGWRGEPDGARLHIEEMEAVGRNPIQAILWRNWLLPGSWLCRTERVSGQIFEGMPAFRECTYLALRFATEYRTLFLQRPTVVWYTDSPASASKSSAYLLSGPSALGRILEMDLPPVLRDAYQRSMGEMLHSVADWHCSEGHAALAWRNHLASLGWPGGWRYLRYTLRLLLAPMGL